MKSSAALPFELPSIPATGVGFPMMPSVASDVCVAGETVRPATFDDVLQANTAPTPIAPPSEVEPQRGAQRTESADSGRPALIAPAGFQDRVPMPASLLRQAPSETGPTEQVSREPASPVTGKSVAPARESDGVAAVETAVYERVLASGLVLPVVQPAAVPAKPETGGSEDFARSEPEPSHAFSGRRGFAGPAIVSPRVSETAATSNESIPLESAAQVPREVSLRPDLPIARQNPVAEISSEPVGEPRVVTRQITVAGRRLEASSLGEFGAIKLQRAPVRVDRGNAGELVASESVVEMPGRAALPAKLFQPVVGSEAIQVFQTVLGAGENVSVAVNLDPLGRPRLAKTGGREALASTRTVLPAIAETAPSDSAVPVDLAKVVENRLKAEGITLHGPVRIELIKAPTVTEPGEFKVQAEKQEVKISGWWNQAGRMVLPNPIPSAGTVPLPMTSLPRPIGSDALPASSNPPETLVGLAEVDHPVSGGIVPRHATIVSDQARRPEIDLTQAPAAPGANLAKAGGFDRGSAPADRWVAAGSLVPAAAGQDVPRPQGKSDRKIRPVGSVITPPVLSRSATSGDFLGSAQDADSSAKQQVSTPSGSPVPQRFNLNSTGGISSARQAVAMRSTNDQEEFAGDAGNRVAAVSLRKGDTLGKSRPQDLLTELRPCRLRIALPGWKSRRSIPPARWTASCSPTASTRWIPSNASVR